MNIISAYTIANFDCICFSRIEKSFDKFSLLRQIHEITEKSRFRNLLRRKKKFSRSIPIPTKTVGSLNRNRKNQKSRKKRKNLKKKRKRNIKKINEIEKTWFYMFIIDFKVLEVKNFYFYWLRSTVWFTKDGISNAKKSFQICLVWASTSFRPEDYYFIWNPSLVTQTVNLNQA